MLLLFFVSISLVFYLGRKYSCNRSFDRTETGLFLIQCFPCDGLRGLPPGLHGAELCGRIRVRLVVQVVVLDRGHLVSRVPVGDDGGDDTVIVKEARKDLHLVFLDGVVWLGGFDVDGGRLLTVAIEGELYLLQP